MSLGREQTAYCATLWDRIQVMGSVRVKKLPGHRGGSAANNTHVLDTDAEIAEFGELAESVWFDQMHLRYPHTVATLGTKALIAIVRSTTRRRHQELVSLQIGSPRHIGSVAMVPVGLRKREDGGHIDRPFVETATEIDQPGISLPHLLIGNFGEAWLAQDLGSRNGTRLAFATMVSTPSLLNRLGIPDIPDSVPPNLRAD